LKQQCTLSFGIACPPRALDSTPLLGHTSGCPRNWKERLASLHWQWIPYAASGIPLAGNREGMASAPETDVLILGNHGLVVCAQDANSEDFCVK